MPVANRWPYAAIAWAVISLSAIVFISALITRNALEQPAVVDLAKFHPGKSRHLKPEQVQQIKVSFQKRPSVRNIQFYISSSTDSESQIYEGEIYDAFHDAGAHIMGAPLGACGDDIDIVVTIFDPDHPSAEALDIMAILVDAKLKYYKELWEPLKPAEYLQQIRDKYDPSDEALK